jgi:hypothetical protein
METFIGKIMDVLPSRVVMRVMTTESEPILKTFGTAPMIGIIDIRPGSIVKINVDIEGEEPVLTFEQGQPNDYYED